jgi:hypothetical protein
MIDLTDDIKKLSEQASKAEDSGDAQRWSQAAANVAHAMETARNCLAPK